MNAALNVTPSINLRSTALGGQVEWLLGMVTLAGGPVVPRMTTSRLRGKRMRLRIYPRKVPGNWASSQGALANL